MDLEPVVPEGRVGLASEWMFLAVSTLVFVASVGLTVYWSTSGAMSTGMMGSSSMPDQSWLGAAVSFVGMWLVMMVAMMLPSLVPILSSYRRSAHQPDTPRLGGLTARAGAGYFFVWTIFGVIAYLLSMVLASAEMQWSAVARWAPGVVLLLAGCFQLTPWKTRQLVCCRAVPAPETSQSSNVRDAWRYGLRLGVHCTACCLGFMVILLVNGLMDLALMGILAAAITGERSLPKPERVARAVGIGIIVVGAVALVRALNMT